MRKVVSKLGLSSLRMQPCTAFDREPGMQYCIISCLVIAVTASVLLPQHRDLLVLQQMSMKLAVVPFLSALQQTSDGLLLPNH